MADDRDVAEKTIAEDLVVTKYKMAGEIVNSELSLLTLLLFNNLYKKHTNISTYFSKHAGNRPYGRYMSLQVLNV